MRVSALGEVLGVSEITIRRDLEKLGEQGILERTHGGAILTQRMRQEPLCVKRERLEIEASARLGAPPRSWSLWGETVFVNSGSMTRQIFSDLAHIPRLRIIARNAAAIAELSDREESLESIVGGGKYLAI